MILEHNCCIFVANLIFRNENRLFECLNCMLIAITDIENVNDEDSPEKRKYCRIPAIYVASRGFAESI